jgi:hypothetical protein
VPGRYAPSNRVGYAAPLLVPTGRRLPRRIAPDAAGLHRVVCVARDEVQVEVEDVLPGPAAAVLPQVHAERAELVLRDSGEQVCGGHDGRRFVAVGIPDVAPVLSRNHEQVPPRRGRLAEEGDDRVVGVDDLLLPPAGDDLAEGAVAVAARQVSLRRPGRRGTVR